MAPRPATSRAPASAPQSIRALRRQLDDVTRLVSDVVWSTDRDLRITGFSDRVTEILGYHPLELAGKAFEEFGRFRDQTIFKAIAMNRPFRDIPYAATAKDGGLRQMLLSGLPVYADGSQEFTGYRGTARDITEASRAEHALKKLSSAVEHSPAMVVITDRRGIIEYTNPRITEMTGYRADDIAGQPVQVLNAAYPDATANNRLLECVKAGDVWREEFQSQKKDGGIFWEMVSISGVLDEAGEVAFLVIVKEDISERKHAETELHLSMEKAEGANKAKTEFLAKMSHELRTPLNAIIGFSQAMMEQLFGDIGNPLYREYAEDINNSGYHLLGIINDILDLAKIEAGKFALDEKEVDVGAIARWCAGMLKSRAEAGGVSLHTDVPDGLPPLLGDETALRQIGLNLVSNAVKFTPEKGAVTIRVVPGEYGSLSLIVRDSGIGIPAAQLEKVFQPFEQVDNTLARKYEGTGLGLPNAKALVELHGGTIGIDSTPDKGTTVTVTLPGERVLTGKPSAATEKKKKSKGNGKKTCSGDKAATGSGQPKKRPAKTKS